MRVRIKKVVLLCVDECTTLKIQTAVSMSGELCWRRREETSALEL